MNWQTFVTQRGDRRAAALHAAQRWHDGDRAPARGLLGQWRFGADLCDVVLDQLVTTPPCPGPDAVGARLAPADALTVPARPGRDLPGLQWIEQIEAPSMRVDPLRCTAWALAELQLLGCQVERRRRNWRTPFHAMPEAEAHAAAWWAAWLTRTAWTVQASTDAILWPIAQQVYGAILSATAMPRAAQRCHLADFRDVFAFLFFESDACGEVAARVIETLAPGPIAALGNSLDASNRLRAGRCAVARGHGPTTADRVFEGVRGHQVRGRLLAEQMQQPERLDQLLDLHTVLRLCDRWATPAQTPWARNWECVVQNRGRARARLRALVSELPTQRLQARLAQVEQLGARTVQAVRSFVRAWAWREARLGWPGNSARRVDPPCPISTDALYDADAQQALRAWVLLVILRGRVDHLQRWITAGSTGDRDATWGRLLSESLPAHLRGDGSARIALQRVRAELAIGLSEILTTLFPVIESLAAQQDSLPSITAFHQALRPFWHHSIPLPQVRVRRYVQHAAHAKLRERVTEMMR